MSILKEIFLQNKVFAHPTEGVWGLGCNPFSEEAVENLFNLKLRPREKGVIILAGHIEQLDHFLGGLPEEKMNTLFTKWPGPHTWLIPPTATTPSWLQGKSGSVAVRLSTHPTVINITQELGSSICSTSANLSGNEPAKNPNEIKKIFGEDLFIVEGTLGKLNKPTPVQDLETGKWIRK